MNKLLIGICILFLIVSCDSNNKTNNGYMLAENPEFGDKLIINREDTSFYRYVGSNNEKKILQKGVVLKYHSFNGDVDSIYSWGGGEVISSCIVKYGIDSTFFIVEQKPLNDIFGKLENVGNELLRNNKPINILGMKIMLKDCNCSKYWIINKLTDDVYGSYKWEEYVQKRKELGVSEELILKYNENL